MKLVRRLLGIAVIAAAFAAAYQFGKNAEPLTVSLFGWATPPAPAWAVLLAAFGLGALVAAGILGFQVLRLSLLARRYRKELAALESEVHQLRNLPLAADASAGLPAQGRRG